MYVYLPITTSFCPVQVSGHCTMGIVAQFEGLRDPLTQSLMLWFPSTLLAILELLHWQGAHYLWSSPFSLWTPMTIWKFEPIRKDVSENQHGAYLFFVPFNIISVSFTSLNYLEFLHVYKTTYLQICLHTRHAIYHCYFTKQYITNIFSLQLSYLSFLIFNAQIILYCWIYHNLFNHCLSVGL